MYSAVTNIVYFVPQNEELISLYVQSVYQNFDSAWSVVYITFPEM